MQQGPARGPTGHWPVTVMGGDRAEMGGGEVREGVGMVVGEGGGGVGGRGEGTNLFVAVFVIPEVTTIIVELL